MNTKSFRNRFVPVSFNLVLPRQVAFGLLILSICLPILHVTYVDFSSRYQLETVLWYTSLLHRYDRPILGQGNEPVVISQDYFSLWSVHWFAISIFAFPLVLMYFGLKKKLTFDLGIAIFAVFLGTQIMPPFISPMNAEAAGWDAVRPELLSGTYLAAIVLVAYGVARLLIPWEISRLGADRLPPRENASPPELALRSVVLVLALLSFILPFAVEYSVNRFPDNPLFLSVASYWYGNVGYYPPPFNILFLPAVYLPLIMMWFGLRRSSLLSKGVAVFTLYWVWHLLLFLQIRTEVRSDFVHISAPALGLAFFPAVLIVYAFTFLHMGQKISQLWHKLSETGGKLESKAFFKKCTNCGRDIPLASEQCPYCQAKQP